MYLQITDYLSRNCITKCAIFIFKEHHDLSVHEVFNKAHLCVDTRRNRKRPNKGGKQKPKTLKNFILTFRLFYLPSYRASEQVADSRDAGLRKKKKGKERISEWSEGVAVCGLHSRIYVRWGKVVDI